MCHKSRYCFLITAIMFLIVRIRAKLLLLTIMEVVDNNTQQRQKCFLIGMNIKTKLALAILHS
jgi:hypothetical protein